MNNNKKIYRQGDIILYQIENLPPTNLKKIKNNNNKFVVAESETTGHQHLLCCKKMKIFQDKNGNFYLDLKEKAQLTHPEHKVITILPSTYKVIREQEYDYFAEEIKKVDD
ncbi:MAG: hypothetical protein QW469_00320 [Candidatus Aenigmatarchaeota archaeon]